MTKRQRITHGVDSFVPNYNEELGTQETSIISSRKPLYFCDQCNYKTIEKGNLNRHKMAIHGVERTWLYCDKCDYKTLRNEHLNRHKQAVHKILYI